MDMNGEMTQFKTGSGPVPLYVVHPKGKPKGGVIVIHEVWGLAPHIKDVADRFAEAGYLAIAPDLLADAGITAELVGDLQEQLFDPERRTQVQPKLRELMAPLQAPGFGEKTTARVRECFHYLEDQPDLRGHVAIVGFCFGGTYSFTLAVEEPALKAAVPFYGHADFTVEELKNIMCPILAFYGEQDERLVTGLDKLTADMQEAHVDFSSHVYPNCGHAFFNDSNRFSYNEAAAKDSWKRTLDFLAAHI
jgi:carboxymethylenebutenolidase